MRTPLAVAGALTLCAAALAAPAPATPQVPDFSGIYLRVGNLWFDPILEESAQPVQRLTVDHPNADDIYAGDFDNPILQSWAREIVKRNAESEMRLQHVYTADDSCWPSGVPQALNLIGPLQILQLKDHVVLIHERDQQVRRVWLNVGHSANPPRSWYGESVGHYEGDTLVVDTIAQKTHRMSVVDAFGTPHTEAASRGRAVPALQHAVRQGALRHGRGRRSGHVHDAVEGHAGVPAGSERHHSRRKCLRREQPHLRARRDVRHDSRREDAAVLKHFARRILAMSAALGLCAIAADAAPAPVAPDFSGIWARERELWLQPVGDEEGVGIPIEPILVRGRDRNNIYAGQWDNPILQPWAREIVKRNAESELAFKHVYTADDTCWPSGVPQDANRPDALQFIQLKDRVMIIHERDQQVRWVWLNRGHSAERQTILVR